MNTKMTSFSGHRNRKVTDTQPLKSTPNTLKHTQIHLYKSLDVIATMSGENRDKESLTESIVLTKMR